jgi:hypothetical protein
MRKKAVSLRVVEPLNGAGKTCHNQFLPWQQGTNV